MNWITVLYFVGRGFFVNLPEAQPFARKDEACAVAGVRHRRVYALQSNIVHDTMRLVEISCVAKENRG